MARMNARQDSSGRLLLLWEQARGLCDQQMIQLGLEYLSESSKGEHFTRFHAEAGTAAEHCLAASFKEARWDRVVENYLLLEQASPSAIHWLNRAVAVAESQGPDAGLSVLREFEPPTWLIGSYRWSAVLADLHGRTGEVGKANEYREQALSLAPTEALRMLLQHRLKFDNTN